MKKVKFVQQPCDTTCVMACFSMMTGIPVRLLQERLGYKTPPDTQAIDHALYELMGPDFNRYHYPSINKPGYYMVTVPSINLEGRLHCVIIGHYPDGRMTVLDPNIGREGKRHYTACQDTDYDQVTLTSWTEVVQFNIPAPENDYEHEI